MPALSHSRRDRPPLRLIAAVPNSSVTHLRLRVYLPQQCQHQPILSQLIATSGLRVNITEAMLGRNLDTSGYFDLEWTGTIRQIHNGLEYLKALNLTVKGKPNVDGDGWYC
ncbi:NIL domain-containing protein [Oculatella sp. LEGE 06141]|uniref:NIL domain-containing protein n=1 Tax=Oculatella sp. LEGE 06141 TaxID=1828648 RepID=UPI00188006B6|nr:NIL domain-containing protein [Oculatella sp. LEGE 06141]MBE9181338.1 NIL domain-containing protein [Oculatella sp. LEGE 06141]